MSTSTDQSQTTEADANATPTALGTRSQNWLLITLVFVGGIVSLGIETAASRLFAPYFGTSLFVWANLIGLILLYLTIGYYVGGRLADRYPRPGVLYLITAIASLLTAVIPLVAAPILTWSQGAFATYSIGIFYGSLVGVLILFAPSMILLGCVSPFAIRLSVDQVGKAGRTAGRLYAISTAGSIAGSFLPVLVLIPYIGTRLTFVTLAAALLVVSIIGLILSGVRPRPTKAKNSTEETTSPTNPERPKGFNKGLLSLILLIPVLLAPLGMQGPIKPLSQTDNGKLLEERESGHNYIRVVQSGTETQLILNEGLGVHSIYDPNKVLVDGPWDYFMVAPYFNNPPYTEKQVRTACIIGLGAGTIPREFEAAYGNQVKIDGVELDQAVVDVGRKYFDLDRPNLNVIVQDGRYHIRTTSQRYDVIGLDAYQQPYIPFQLTSVEFLHELKDHLTSTGVVVMNVGRTGKDYRLVDAMSQNLHTVFPNVYIIDSTRFSNSLLVATAASTKMSNFAENALQLQNPYLQEVAIRSLSAGNLREEKRSHVYFTDDLAPVEQLIDSIIFTTVEQGQ
jgi:MFS family permease